MAAQIVIVGAGWAGLAVAKIFLEVDATADLLVLEAGNSVGGTWSAERIYSTLKTHSTLGLFEYPEFPMDPKKHLEPDYLDGKRISIYLQRFAERFDLMKNIRFNTKVSDIKRNADGNWELCANEKIVKCEKLVLATGLSSVPHFLDIPRADFVLPVLHSKDLAQAEASLRSKDVKTAIVYGGSKSSFDAVHLLAEAGKQVHWIIRPNAIGHGVSAQCISKVPIIGAKLITITSTRFVSSFSPCVYGPDNLWSRFLYKSTMGKMIVAGTWKVLDLLVRFNSGFSRSENGSKLLPKGTGWMFWCFGHIGIMTQPRFWENVHAAESNITVHRAEITQISGRTVYLSNNEQLATDAIVSCSGWKTNQFDNVIPSASPPSGKFSQEEMALDAKRELLERFPVLAEADSLHPATKDSCQLGKYQLYRAIAPAPMAASGDNSLVYLGIPQTAQSAMVSYAQGLWAVAYLTGKLSLPSEEKIWRDAAKTSSWFVQRYPTLGVSAPYAIYDHIAFIDTWLRDVGIEPRRKPHWLAEWFGIYRPADYDGVVTEWLPQLKKKK